IDTTTMRRTWSHDDVAATAQGRWWISDGWEGVNYPRCQRLAAARAPGVLRASARQVSALSERNRTRIDYDFLCVTGRRRAHFAPDA
ncbi:MAG: hypothetical protein ACRDVW_05935, partial [Acidimicrobiales bacterium]